MGEPFDESPQDQGGIQVEEILPTGREEGMGETRVEPIEVVDLETEDSDPRSLHIAPDNVESGAENEGTVPPPSSRRNRRLVFADGDGGSANMEARDSTLRSSDPAAPARGSRTMTVQSPRIQPVQSTQPIEEEIAVEEIDEERIRQERKRKGKDIAPPEPQKKKLRRLARTGNQGVVIRDQAAGATPPPRLHEETIAPEPNIGREDPATWLGQDEVLPEYSKIKIKLDDRLLQEMTMFPDPRMEEVAAGRVSKIKKLRAGKRIHNDSLQFIDLETDFIQYISAIGFDWLLGIETARVPEELAKEFFTTFRLSKVTDLHSKCITFRMFNRQMRMSLTEWSARLGIHTVEQAVRGDWVSRHFGQPTSHPEFDQQSAWRLVTYPQVGAFVPSVSNAVAVQDPALRLAQVFLGYNLLGQANTSASVTQAELFFMWCMKTQTKVHLGYWLAFSCHQLAIKTTRHLNICHILDSLIRHGFEVKVQPGTRLTMCPKPEPFDLQFFVRVKILSQDSGTYILYTPERAESEEDDPSQERRVATPVKQRAQPQAKRVTKKKPDARLVVAKIAEEKGDGSTEGWRERVENLLGRLVDIAETQQARLDSSQENTQRLLTQLVDIAEAQRDQVARAVDVMEQMLRELRTNSRRPDQRPSR